jgi:hypothetical protein
MGTAPNTSCREDQLSDRDQPVSSKQAGQILGVCNPNSVLALCQGNPYSESCLACTVPGRRQNKGLP